MKSVHRSAVGVSIAVSWLLGLAAAPAPAQSANAPRKVYTNRQLFTLPVRIDERDRAALKELRFYVKCLQGGPRPGEWVCAETALPNKTKFPYQAAADGEYWFAFVTVDRSGRVAPANLDREPPGLIVVVDTKAPDIDVQKLPVASGEVYLQCQVRDANADYGTLKLEYQAGDRSWRALEAVPDTPGVYRVPEPGVLHSLVRASAGDKAGNRTVREIDLSHTPTPAANAIAARPPAPPTTTLVSNTSAPEPVSGPRLMDPPAPAPAPVPRVAEKPPAAEVAPNGSPLLLNGTHCRLEYALDTPNVTRVEGYATRDGGRTWMRLGEDTDRRSPFEFRLPGEGVYGITLVVSTASRPGTPPGPGDAPDCWVDIDTSKPAVQMTDIRVGTGDDAGLLVMSWSVQDKNLGQEGVELSWSSQPDGPWQSALRGLKPEGTARWPVPPEAAGRVYLKLEATDRAGNVGRWETREPIVLETGRPRVRILSISAVRPGA